MTKAGESILRGAREALAFTKGEKRGSIVHIAAKAPDDIYIKAIREKLSLSQAGFALKFGFTPPTPSKTGNRGPESHPFKPAPFSR
jgi:putative transcriptional regulator